MMMNEQSDREDYWKNELNDTQELAALADNIKQIYYQEYKTAYDDVNPDEPKFDGII